MTSRNQYWKGVEELEKSPEYVDHLKNEFSDALPMQDAIEGIGEFNTNRRDFLKYFGFSIGAVALAACNKTPIKHAVPYVEKPQDVTPGLANYYATTCDAYAEGIPVLVKVREGRPIKLDGNRNAYTHGSMDATGQASILSLYDTSRIEQPSTVSEGVLRKSTWDKVDAEIKAKLDKIQSAGQKVAVVTSSSPSLYTKKAIETFKQTYPGAEHIVYDAISYSGMLDANEASFGKRMLPKYEFLNADVIVSFGADFLGSWVSPSQFLHGYSTNRIPTKEGKMSRHIQFESTLSLTGANADTRVPMKDSNMGAHLLKLYTEVARLSGGQSINDAGAAKELPGNTISKTAKELWAAKGRSLVVCGSNMKEHQVLVNCVNQLLGNYGKTLKMDKAFKGYSYAEKSFDGFVDGINNGMFGGAIFLGVNPAYSYHKSDKLVAGLKKATLSVSTGITPDETVLQSQYACPETHWLESWNIKEPIEGYYTFSQPAISPVFDSRQGQESLMAWAGNLPKASKGHSVSYDAIKSICQEVVYSGTLEFTSFWNQCLHDGFYEKSTLGENPVLSFNSMASDAVPAILGVLNKNKNQDNLELVLYQKSAVKDGTEGGNPWVHELPDPISKVCWDNYLTIGKTDADKRGLKQGDLVTLKAGGKEIKSLPVLVQPGQVSGTVAVALGYGKLLPKSVKNDLKDLGKNAFPLVQNIGGATSYTVTQGVEVVKEDGSYELAQTQTHHSFEGRDIIREATIEEYVKNPYVRNEHHHNLITLWEDHNYSTGHHWGMAIDMNACTGCGACVVSCSIENNVPIVGRDEIRRRREMHWLRIDRYYSFSSEEGYLTKENDIDALTEANAANNKAQDHYENVNVVFQPIMCQHCNNAPCETVCPVLATTHSTEGLNQMTYNRCIGTKYCGNNCPYKVRRFNWFKYAENDKFDYHFNNDLGKMVINPDVTVRSRGVMEKCSFCVQRIQDAKVAAKRDGRTMKDGDVKVACQMACTSGAIVFGDLNDPESEISKKFKDERAYHLLAEVNTRPGVAYMTKIRNVKKQNA